MPMGHIYNATKKPIGVHRMNQATYDTLSSEGYEDILRKIERVYNIGGFLYMNEGAKNPNITEGIQDYFDNPNTSGITEVAIYKDGEWGMINTTHGVIHPEEMCWINQF